MKTRAVFLLLILWAFQANAQGYLTNGEVFNYEVGDTFILKRWIAPEAQLSILLDYTTYVVIQKNNGANTFEYKIQRYTATNPNGTSGLLDTISPIYGMGGVVYCSLEPNIAPSYPYDTIWDEGVNDTATDLCSAPFRTTQWLRHYGYVAASEIYGEGFGLIRRDVPVAHMDQLAIWHYDIASELLVYCHKANGTICGSRVYMGLEETQNSLKTMVYPNPATGDFVLQAARRNGRQSIFYLFNAVGERMLEVPINEATNLINRNGLADGLYFWRIEVPGQPAACGKLLLQ